jgi:hypothetical protein
MPGNAMTAGPRKLLPIMLRSCNGAMLIIWLLDCECDEYGRLVLVTKENIKSRCSKEPQAQEAMVFRKQLYYLLCRLETSWQRLSAQEPTGPSALSGPDYFPRCLSVFLNGWQITLGRDTLCSVSVSGLLVIIETD